MQRFGKYEVVRQIGEGGFGKVYEGWDPDIKRRVAIKTCLADYPEVRSRFLREASIAGNLQHRNITVVFDLGEQDGVPYLVQEHLAGEDLDQLIARVDQAELHLATRVTYLSQLARGLGYAHSQGVIHRDIKPSNLRILEEDLLKIMDFGIAKSNRGDTSLTATGETVGTSTYLSPEQVRGEAKLDAGCDIYGFGAVAFELLCLRPLYEPSSPQRLIYRIVKEPAPDLADVDPELPHRLCAVVRRCLQKERQLRYANCGELLMELNQIGAAELERSASLSGPTFQFRSPQGTSPATASPKRSAGFEGAPSTARAGAAERSGAASSSREPNVRETNEFAATSPSDPPRPEPTSTGLPLSAPPRSPSSSRPDREVSGSRSFEDGKDPEVPDDPDAPEELQESEESEESAHSDDSVEFDTAEVEPLHASLSGTEDLPESFGIGSLRAGTPSNSTSALQRVVLATVLALVGASLLALWWRLTKDSTGAVPPARTAASQAPVGPPELARGPADAPPTAPRPENATLRILPGWDPSIRVSLDGRNAVVLDQELLQELPPGRHVLEFSVLLDDYQAFENLTIELEANQRLVIEPPLAEPGRLSFTAPPTSRELFVRLDGSPLGWTPVEARRVVPGSHRLEVAASPESEERRITLDIKSGVQTSVVCGLDERVDVVVRERPLR